MKYIQHLAAVVLIAGVTLLTPCFVLAANDPELKDQPSKPSVPGDKLTAASSSDKQEGTQEGRAETPAYKPPLRGAPGGRLGGGTRGGGNESLFLSALAPDHTGLTAQEQPSLYWFLPEATKYPIEFTLIEDKAQKPLVEIRVPQGAQPGVQVIRLADYNVRLKTGAQYQWFVAAVADAEQRSKDIIAGAEIQRIDLDSGLRAKLEQVGKPGAPSVYAEAGLWYDALSSLADLIAANPGDSQYRRQRAALLNQVGLKEVATYEEKR
ncbi:MAG TPA: hypothetical protein DCZ69_17680 [Syntrophobacteraceae bacterium]|nr:hypothetical protein [Syntrophobacteraceae bacterium]HBZ56361.1 hypothetical protein [Syntrophobacteraceae bacterium]